MDEFYGYTEPLDGQSVAGFLGPILTGPYTPTSPVDVSNILNNHILQQAGFAPMGGGTASIGNLASGGFNYTGLRGLAAQDPYGAQVLGQFESWANEYLGSSITQQQLPNLYSSWDPNLSFGTNIVSNAINAGILTSGGF